MNFLEELYFGNLQPCELPPKESRAHGKAVYIFTESENALEEILGENEKKLLRRMDAHSTLLAEESLASFKRGYRCCMEMLFSCFGCEL